MKDRKDQLAIVTGAAGDIGRAIAAALSESHAKVVLVDIDAEALSNALSLLSGSGFVAKTCDVTDPADLSRLAADVAELGDVATLVNNAGAARAVSLHDTTAEIWRQDNALNLEAPFLCFRAFEDALKRTQGSVSILRRSTACRFLAIQPIVRRRPD